MSFSTTNEDIVTSRMETSGLDSVYLHGERSPESLFLVSPMTILLNRMKKQEDTEDICYSRKTVFKQKVHQSF